VQPEYTNSRAGQRRRRRRRQWPSTTTTMNNNNNNTAAADDGVKETQARARIPKTRILCRYTL